MEKNRILIRPAQPEDRGQMLAISAAIGDDYLDHVLDRWLAEERGEFSVALLGGRIVGYSKFSQLLPGQGWLQGARVDVNLQGQGIGRALTHHHMELARIQGCATLRMVTDSDNIASRTLAEKLGFFLAGEYTRFRCAPLSQGAAVPQVEKYMGLPPIPGNGIVSAGWTFYSWDEAMMEQWALEGKLYGSCQAGMAMMQGNRRERVNILMLWGAPEEVRPLLTFARRQPPTVELVNCIVSDDKYDQILLDAGYKNLDDHTMVVYQYNL